MTETQSCMINKEKLSGPVILLEREMLLINSFCRPTETLSSMMQRGFLSGHPSPTPDHHPNPIILFFSKMFIIVKFNILLMNQRDLVKSFRRCFIIKCIELLLPLCCFLFFIYRKRIQQTPYKLRNAFKIIKKQNNGVKTPQISELSQNQNCYLILIYLFKGSHNHAISIEKKIYLCQLIKIFQKRCQTLVQPLATKRASSQATTSLLAMDTRLSCQQKENLLSINQITGFKQKPYGPHKVTVLVLFPQATLLCSMTETLSCMINQEKLSGIQILLGREMLLINSYCRPTETLSSMMQRGFLSGHPSPTPDHHPNPIILFFSKMFIIVKFNILLMNQRDLVKSFRRCFIIKCIELLLPLCCFLFFIYRKRIQQTPYKLRNAFKIIKKQNNGVKTPQISELSQNQNCYLILIYLFKGSHNHAILKKMTYFDTTLGQEQSLKTDNYLSLGNEYFTIMLAAEKNCSLQNKKWVQGSAIWSSGSKSDFVSSSKITIQHDGNLVIYNADGTVAWSSKSNA